MATKRLRGESWEYHVKRKNLLPKTLTFTFSDEAEGDAYVEKLEQLLDRGLVPPELADHQMNFQTIADVVGNYIKAVFVPDTDQKQLASMLNDKFSIGLVRMPAINYAWAEGWVASMKHERMLAPNTIRHYVGALARCFDWLNRKFPKILASNPLRALPRNYAKYNDDDVAVVELAGGSVKTDDERDRRPTEAELARCRAVMDRQKQPGKERPLDVRWQGAIEALFELAPETSMRLREMFTLSFSQVDLSARTLFLDKTKNGDKRQVPLSTTAVRILKTYIEQVEAAERGMAGFEFQNGSLFPWVSETAEQKRKTTALLSRQFARIFDAAECGDLRFHDLRHEGTCRLYERTQLSDIQIAKITGHKDLRMLKRYANLRASDLAEMLW